MGVWTHDGIATVVMEILSGRTGEQMVICQGLGQVYTWGAKGERGGKDACWEGCIHRCIKCRIHAVLSHMYVKLNNLNPSVEGEGMASTWIALSGAKGSLPSPLTEGKKVILL